MALEKLKLAMLVTMTLLFGTLAGAFGLFLYFNSPGLGVDLSLMLIVLFVVGLTAVQWYLAPSIIKWTTRMRELSPQDYPWLHEMVEKLSHKAGIKKPKLFLVHDATPNAFAFGRTKNDSNVAVHAGLLNVLNKDELEAVLAHEVGHIRNWDVAVITLASMVPLLIYYLVIMFASRDRDNQPAYAPILVFVGAMVAQFLSSLIVMYLSRTREYYADAFAAVATNNPAAMRTALAKIVYGFPALAHASEDYSAKRAFYIADPVSSSDIGREIEQSEHKRRHEVETEGHKLKADEVKHAMEWERKTGYAKFSEFFSTHPLTFKRIDALQGVEQEIKQGKLTLQNV